MRAKLVISSITRNEDNGETLKMIAVSKFDGYGDDGLDENNTYAKFSPSADFEIYITNPALHGKFEPDQQYYADFTLVAEKPTKI